MRVSQMGGPGTAAVVTSQPVAAQVMAPPAPTAPAPTPPVTQPDFITAPIDAPQPEGSSRSVVLAGVTALVLALLARLVFAGLSADAKPAGELIAQLPVGPAGGSTTFDGGKIKVPKGALERDENITIRRARIDDRIRALSPSGTSIIIPAGTQIVYIFGPSTLVFLKPVTIVLPAPPPPAQGLVFLSANGQIVFVDGTTNDGQIKIQVNSFNFGQGSSIVVQS